MIPKHNPDGSVPRWFALYRAGLHLRKHHTLSGAAWAYHLWRRPLMTELTDKENWR